MKQLLLITAIFASAASADGQTKNSIYIEFFGNSANLYSVNYDRVFFTHQLKSTRWAKYSLRAGVNYTSSKFAMPVMINYFRGNKSNIEIGAGYVLFIENDKRKDGAALFAGYRFSPVKTGLMARFGFSPTYVIQGDDHWAAVYGISFGIAF